MRGLRGSAPLCALAALAALASGCGGGGERQDADEPSGNYSVEVVEASFPERQQLAEKAEMRVRIRNADSKTIPNLAITVDGFSTRSEQAGLADPTRPVWIIDDGPRGGVTAYTNTWALGRVRAGETKEFVWEVTPVKAGRFEVKYRVAAGLDGKAKAVSSGGDRPSGAFSVDVDREPDDSRVDPDTGDVVEAN